MSALGLALAAPLGISRGRRARIPPIPSACEVTTAVTTGGWISSPGPSAAGLSALFGIAGPNAETGRSFGDILFCDFDMGSGSAVRGAGVRPAMECCSRQSEEEARMDTVQGKVSDIAQHAEAAHDMASHRAAEDARRRSRARGRRGPDARGGGDKRRPRRRRATSRTSSSSSATTSASPTSAPTATA